MFIKILDLKSINTDISYCYINNLYEQGFKNSYKNINQHSQYSFKKRKNKSKYNLVVIKHKINNFDILEDTDLFIKLLRNWFPDNVKIKTINIIDYKEEDIPGIFDIKDLKMFTRSL